MKNLNELLQAKEQEFAVLIQQKQDLEQELSELTAKHKGSVSDMQKSEQAGLMDKFKKALRLKKDLSREIEDTQETLDMINNKVTAYKQAGEPGSMQTVSAAVDKDLNDKKVELKPKFDEMNTKLEEALALYEEIGESYKAFESEAREKVKKISSYIARPTQDHIRQSFEFRTIGYKSDVIEEYKKVKRKEEHEAQLANK